MEPKQKLIRIMPVFFKRIRQTLIFITLFSTLSLSAQYQYSSTDDNLTSKYLDKKKFFAFGICIGMGMKSINYEIDDLTDYRIYSSLFGPVMAFGPSMYWNFTKFISLNLNPTFEMMPADDAELSAYIPLNLVIYPVEKLGLNAGGGFGGPTSGNPGLLLNFGLQYFINNYIYFSLTHFRNTVVLSNRWGKYGTQKSGSTMFNFCVVFGGIKQKNPDYRDSYDKYYDKPYQEPYIEEVKPVIHDYSDYSDGRLKELLEDYLQKEDYENAKYVQEELDKRNIGSEYDSLSIDELKKLLEEALSAEDYEKAAVIQGIIDKKN